MSYGAALPTTVGTTFARPATTYAAPTQSITYAQAAPTYVTQAAPVQSYVVEKEPEEIVFSERRVEYLPDIYVNEAPAPTQIVQQAPVQYISQAPTTSYVQPRTAYAAPVSYAAPAVTTSLGGFARPAVTTSIGGFGGYGGFGAGTRII
jgi:hypothetical protein